MYLYIFCKFKFEVSFSLVIKTVKVHIHILVNELYSSFAVCVNRSCRKYCSKKKIVLLPPYFLDSKELCTQ